MIVYLQVSLADSHFKHKILAFRVFILLLRLFLLGLPGFELLLELFIFIIEYANPMLLLTRLTF